MLTWFVVGAVAVAAVVCLVRLASHLTGHSRRVNAYYAASLGAWILHRDTAARAAALTALKVADPVQRASMLAFLDICRSMLVERGSSEPEIREVFAVLATDARAAEWTLADVVRAKRELAAVDVEYARALDKADSRVFERRYPEVV